MNATMEPPIFADVERTAIRFAAAGVDMGFRTKMPASIWILSSGIAPATGKGVIMKTGNLATTKTGGLSPRQIRLNDFS